MDIYVCIMYIVDIYIDVYIRHIVGSRAFQILDRVLFEEFQDFQFKFKLVLKM